MHSKKSGQAKINPHSRHAHTHTDTHALSHCMHQRSISEGPWGLGGRVSGQVKATASSTRPREDTEEHRVIKAN